MDRNKRTKLINALKMGVPLRRISRELGIPLSTLSMWCNGRDKELNIAFNYYKNIVNNLFS